MSGRYLLVPDVVEFIGNSEDWVHRMAAQGRIPHRRIGGTRRLLFLEEELRAWLNGAELKTVKTAHGGRVVRPIA